MKRLIYLLSIVAVIGIVIGIGYFLRYRAAEPEVPVLGELPATPTQRGSSAPSLPTAPLAPGTSAPSAPSQPFVPEITTAGVQFGIAAQNQVSDFFVGTDNNIVFVEPSGKVGRVVRGETALLSSLEIANLWRVSFSYDGQKILAEFGDPASPQYSLFDVEDRSWAPLAPEIKAATWAPASYEIAYLAEKNGEEVLTTLDLSGSKARPREILSLNAKDLSLSWPSPNKVLVIEKSGAAFAASIFEVNLSARTINLLIPPRIGLGVLWNKNADGGLIFVGGRNVRGGELGLVDGKGVLLNRLAFLTLPRKCGFYEKSTQVSTSTKATEGFLLCAIPQNREELDRVPLPDSYDERALYTSDDIYEISLKDGSVRGIYVGEPLNIDGYNFKVFGKNLFFVNRLDGRLYAVALE